MALWLAIISLVITAALFPLFSAVATFATTFLVLRLLAAVAGVAALALSLRTRSSGRSSRHGTWALLLAGVGLFLNVMLILAIVIGVSLSRPSLTEVELRAKGGPTISATFDDDVKTNVVEWQWDGWAQFNTARSEAEITVTAPDGDQEYPVSCTILWDGEVVVQESSDSGVVTCRYEE